MTKQTKERADREVGAPSNADEGVGAPSNADEQSAVQSRKCTVSHTKIVGLHNMPSELT